MGKQKKMKERGSKKNGCYQVAAEGEEDLKLPVYLFFKMFLDTMHTNICLKCMPKQSGEA